MSTAVDILVAVLLLLGAAFTLLGSLALVRFSDVLMRLHGPTKAGTLGVGCVLIASALTFSVSGDGVSVHELLITLFLFLTAPVSAQLMAKCAMFLGDDNDAKPLAVDTSDSATDESADPPGDASPPQNRA